MKRLMLLTFVVGLWFAQPFVPIAHAQQMIAQGQTTVNEVFGPIVSPVDNNTPITGLVSGTNLTVTVSKNGGAFGAPSGAISEVGLGYYAIAGNATDSGTLGKLIVHWDASGGGGNKNENSFIVVIPSFYTGSVGPVITGGTGANQLQTDGSTGSPGLKSGAIDTSQYSNNVKAGMFRFYDVVTGGTSNPSTTDTYVYNGLVNGVMSLVSTTLSPACYLWTDGTFWYLTPSAASVPSSGTSYFKTASGATSVGPYVLQANGGTGSGAPTVTPHGNAVLAGFQPELPGTTTYTLPPNLGLFSLNSSGQTVSSNTLQMAGVTPLFDGSSYIKSDPFILTNSGYTAPPTAAQNATAFWQDTTAGDFTAAASIGKLLLGGAALSASQPAWPFFSNAPSGWMAGDTTTLNAISSNLLTSPVEQTITLKQSNELSLALMFDAARTYNASTHVATDTWYRRKADLTADTTKPVMVKTVQYDTADVQILSATAAINYSNL